MAMHRVLAAFLGLAAFLVVAVYWLWRTLAGQPGLEPEGIAWRALLAMVAAGLVGLLLGRLGISVVSEALQEAGARRRDREALRGVDQTSGEEDVGETRAGAAGARGDGPGV